MPVEGGEPSWEGHWKAEAGGTYGDMSALDCHDGEAGTVAFVEGKFDGHEKAGKGTVTGLAFRRDNDPASRWNFVGEYEAVGGIVGGTAGSSSVGGASGKKKKQKHPQSLQFELGRASYGTGLVLRGEHTLDDFVLGAKFEMNKLDDSCTVRGRITEIAVLHDDEHLPAGFELVCRPDDQSRHASNLHADAVAVGGKSPVPVRLAVARAIGAPPIVDVALCFPAVGGIPEGFCGLMCTVTGRDANLNVGSAAQPMYLCVRFAPVADADPRVAAASSFAPGDVVTRENSSVAILGAVAAELHAGEPVAGVVADAHAHEPVTGAVVDGMVVDATPPAAVAVEGGEPKEDASAVGEDAPLFPAEAAAAAGQQPPLPAAPSSLEDGAKLAPVAKPTPAEPPPVSSALMELKLLWTDAPHRDKVPSGFTKLGMTSMGVEAKLNNVIGGHDVFLCFQKAPPPPPIVPCNINGTYDGTFGTMQLHATSLVRGRQVHAVTTNKGARAGSFGTGFGGRPRLELRGILAPIERTSPPSASSSSSSSSSSSDDAAYRLHASAVHDDGLNKKPPAACSWTLDARLMRCVGAWRRGDERKEWNLVKDAYLELAFQRDTRTMWSGGRLLYSDTCAGHDIDSLVNTFFSPDVLMGREKVNCSSAACGGAKRAFEQRTVLADPPPRHLVVTVKRMDFDWRARRSIKRLQDVPLRPLLRLPGVPAELPAGLVPRAPATGGAGGRAYGLYAVVAHSGPSANSGHYYTFARRSGAKDLWRADSRYAPWVKFNDTRLSFVGFEEMLGLLRNSRACQDSAYLLFYRRLTAGEERCAVAAEAQDAAASGRGGAAGGGAGGGGGADIVPPPALVPAGAAQAAAGGMDVDEAAEAVYNDDDDEYEDDDDDDDEDEQAELMKALALSQGGQVEPAAVSPPPVPESPDAKRRRLNDESLDASGGTGGNDEGGSGGSAAGPVAEWALRVAEKNAAFLFDDLEPQTSAFFRRQLNMHARLRAKLDDDVAASVAEALAFVAGESGTTNKRQKSEDDVVMGGADVD